jgi:hypothetical protein
MKVKSDFLDRGSFKVRNEQKVRFWKDFWLGDTPLVQQYPNLYNVVRQKNVLVHDVLSSAPLNMEFRRVLSNDNWETWILLVRRLIALTLTNGQDKFVWSLSSSENSLSNHIMQTC